MRIRSWAGPIAAVLVAASGVATFAHPAPPPARPQLKTGFDVLAADHYRTLHGQKVGFIANPTSVRADLVHEVDVMHASPDVQLTAVFGPEHGFRGAAQAGGSDGSYTDERTGLPVYDLYGSTAAEIADTFRTAGVDTVLFDIQDAGARFYTYIWTMYDAMQAAASAGVRFVVLDRPNPLGGLDATGPVLHPELATFIGRNAIAQQHGMTVGELAQLFRGRFIPGVRLDVVRMQGWTRGTRYDATGLPWVMPSPNMPTPDTAAVYPGTGMFEGTNLSEGRGTTRPFELIGAPYVDGRWTDALNALHLPGVRFREAYFAPTFSKYAGQTVAGVQVYVTDPARFDSIRTATAMITEAKRLYPADFAWRYDTGDKLDPYWIDKVTGSDRLRTQIDAGDSYDQVVAGWSGELAAFRAVRARYLIYPEGGR